MVTRQQKKIALENFESNFNPTFPALLSVLQSSLSPVSLSGKVQTVKASLLSHSMNAVSVSIPQT